MKQSVDDNIYIYDRISHQSWYMSTEHIDLLWFYGISTIVGYLMPNPLYTYILNIYDKWTHFVDNIFKRAWAYLFYIQLNGFKYCHVSLTIHLNFCYLFTHCWIVKQFYF